MFGYWFGRTDETSYYLKLECLCLGTYAQKSFLASVLHLIQQHVYKGPFGGEVDLYEVLSGWSNKQCTW